jgi:serine/threonine protein kinase
MEFLEGELLQTVLNKYIFNIVQTRIIMKGLIQAITALASKNIVHRDIKP